MERPRYIHNSSNPLQPGEDLYQECEIGLDEEEIYYIRQNHDLQIRVGGEPFYFFQRQSGSAFQKEITTWESTSPTYVGVIWSPTDGESVHPDIRINTTGLAVFNDGTELTRVYEQDFIALDTEYYIERTVGSSESDAGTVKIHFNPGFTPGTVMFRSNTLCSCVDLETGYPNRECAVCKGTSFPASFVQYKCVTSKYNPTNTVLIRVPMVTETEPVTNIGRVRKREHRHWMPRVPYAYNYDLILGTTGRNSGILFEIVGKYDSRIRGILLHQEFDTIRIEKSDIRYTLIPDIT